ncbi:hypothetical protein PG991_001710 [Apiospora marii]|uniref:Nephrocystin 3-like N-terminal domain-containing protein n=1 Tax=Apiospora marii TaxID=335849 RepID=A0ABR1SST0_9PEZI
MSSQSPNPSDIPDNLETMIESPTTIRLLDSPCFGLEWFNTPSPHARYDVILIDGVRDVIGDVWTKNVQSWVETVLLSESPYSVAEFRYDTSSDGAPIYAVNGIEKEATNLLDGLKQDHTEEGGSPQNTFSFDRGLIFISRDFGGLLAKKALCIASRSPYTYQDVLRRTCMMIFYDCPHRSFDLEDLEDNIVQMFSGPGPNSRHGLIQKATRLAFEVEDIHQSCSYSLLWQQIPVLNVITFWGEMEDDEQSIYNYNSHALIQCPLEEYHVTEAEHSQLGLGLQDPNDTESTKVISAIWNFIRNSIATREFPNHKLPQSRILDWLMLLPECPPVRYPAIIKLAAIPFQRWSKSHEQFDDWIQHYDEGFRVAHLYSVSGPAELSEQVLQHVQTRQNWAKVLYFRFYPNDTRLNSTRALLLYFLTQHMRWSNQTCVWPIEALPHAFTTRDLYQCFVDLVWTRNEKRDVWLIIAGIEHADMDLFWFLRQLNELGRRREVPLQVVVTSNGNEKVISQLKDFTTINLSASLDSEQLKNDALMAKTLASRRKLEDMSRSCSDIDIAVPMILQAHFSDPQLADMVLQWTIHAITLRSFSFNFHETLGHILNTSPKMIFQATRNYLPTEQQELAKDVSVIVKAAFRPLTVDEIASALLFRVNPDPTPPSSYFTSNAKDYRRLVERVHQIIPVLFTIEHGEVHFAHDSIMEVQGLGMFPSVLAQHTSMTLICLGYLRLPTTWTLVADLVHERTADNIPGSESRRDFLAVSLGEMLAFFKMDHARAAWLDALNALSGSMCRKSHRNDLSAFQCVAQTGVVDLVTAMVSEQRQSPYFETECVLAISEAALYGHVETVRLLLQEMVGVAPGLKDAISAAASHGNEDVLNLLIDFCSRSQDFVWPDGLLCRAAWLGQGGIVQKLLAIGLSLDWKVDDESSLFLRDLTRLSIDTIVPREQLLVTPLAIALAFGHRQVVRVILEADKTEFLPGLSLLLLGQALEFGDPEVIRLLIEHNIRPMDAVEEEELLHVATESSSYRAIEAMVQAGSDVSWHTEDLPEGHAVGPLITAVGRGYTRCFKHLLQSGVKVNVPNNGKTALFEAVNSRRLEMARMLLAAGADPNVMSDNHLPLITAVNNYDKAMVETLLDNGANIEAYIEHELAKGKTALAVAAGKVDYDILYTLLQRGAEVNCSSLDLSSPLYVAAFKERIENVKILLEHKAQVDDGDARGTGEPTPLNVAFPNAEVVTTLLDHGADINYRSSYGTVLYHVNEVDSFGRTALHLIDAYTPVTFVAALVNAGASTEALDSSGATPLAKAVVSGNIEVFRYLETQSRHGPGRHDTISPLRLACAAGSAVMVEHLVKAGADVNEVDRSTGETPLYALFTGPGASSDIVRFLVEDCGANVNKPGGEFKYPLIKAFTCCIDNHWTSDDRRELVLKIYKNIRLLLQCGADIDAQDDSGRRAVHLALSSLSLTVPWHLFEEFGADLGARDNLGRSALHYAAAMGLPSDFAWLAERAGVGVDLVDSRGWTPLFWATQQRRPANFNPMVQVLKEHGADLWAKTTDSYGVWTPLKLARFRGCFTETALLALIPTEKTRKLPKLVPGGTSDVPGTHHDKQDETAAAPTEEAIETWNDELHETETGTHRELLDLPHRHDVWEKCGFMYAGEAVDSSDSDTSPDLGDDYDDSDEETEKGERDDD